MKIGYTRGENGKLDLKFIEEGEENNPDHLFHVGASFGEVIWTDCDHIAEAKIAILEKMVSTIGKLAKLDEFWVVKTPDGWSIYDSPDSLVDPIPRQAREGKISVACQMNFPQLEGYYNWEEAEQRQKQIEQCLTGK